MGKTILVLAGVLCGCVPAQIFRDPATGQTAQCSASSPPGLFPIVAQWEVDKCAETYERMGWRRQ